MSAPPQRPPATHDSTPIVARLGQLAADRPHEPAIVFEDTTVSRAELEAHTNRLARAYQELGVERDSLVTIALPNGIEFVAATIAAWKAGATPQPVSAKLPRLERDKVLELAAPALVVGCEAAGAAVPALSPGYVPDSTLSDAPLQTAPPQSWKAPTSGGSTGRPKLIKDRRPPTVGVIAWMAYLFGLTPGDVTLTTGPLYHNAVFSSTLTSLATGARVVLMPRFDALTSLKLVARERVSWLYAVPTMMHRIWRLPKAQREAIDVSSLNTVFHNGAPCPPWLKHAWIEWLGAEKIRELYAATEGHAATVITGGEWLEHEGSVGRAVAGEIRILDSNGHELPTDEVGEVWMRPSEGREPPYEYIGATARRRHGWETVGDLGRFDSDGYLYLADRDTDMILVGGANVFPAEVEAALDEHPAVMSSCVIGLPDADLGNRVHALIQIRDHVTDEALALFLSERLVRYKLPRTYERVATPLRDDAGKARRSALREQRLPTVRA
jgi:bile acid-coenzyme A ligase